MAKQSRTFTAQVKFEAASLIINQNYSYLEACRALDIGETVLRRWVSQLREERGGQTPKSVALTPEQKRIQELEARVSRLGSVVI
mgnify:FL=1